jgi:hypothetical protein
VKTLLVIALVVSFAATSGVARANHLPDSDAESIAILAALTPAPQGYWWDHTDLTVAVKAPRRADPEYLSAIGDAIARWSTVLQQEFGGLITLTDVTDTGVPAHRADIVLHYVPHAGGLAFSGIAHCQAGHCSNVLVSTVGPPGHGFEPVSPQELGYLTLHELGHVLGLGHAEPLLETTDLMGYGWIVNGGSPVLSACDITALRVVWAWALEGVDPYPPAVASVVCD